MLLAVRLSTGDGFQRRFFAARATATTLHCRIIFQDLRDDRVAGRLLSGKRGLDAGDAEGAGAFHQQYNFYLASRGRGSLEWPTGIRREDARGIHTAA